MRTLRMALLGAAAVSVAGVAEGAGKVAQGRLGGLAERIAAVAESSGERAASELSARLGLRVRRQGGQDLVPLIIEPRAGLATAEVDAGFVTRLGGLVDARSRSYVRALVPAGAVRALAGHPHAALVRTPSVPMATGGLGPNLSEAVALTGAEDFHSAGISGAGVEVGVVDLGFTGLTSRKNEGELAADTVLVDYSGSGGETGTSHGTGVAEHVADMAPGARIHCIKVSDEVDLQNAADYLAANGIPIANHSVGWVNSSYYDDTGPINGIINESRDTDGVFWTVAAGNDARRHWRGGWTDADGDTWLEFAAADEGLNLTTGSTTATIFLNWNQYGNSLTDLDLYVYNNQGSVVARSEGQQIGPEDPAEALSFTYIAARAPYQIKVKLYAGPSAGLDLTIFSFYNDLEYAQAASSTPDPASAHGAFTVGAINQAQWNDPGPPLEPFSSRGPTNDGRIKPDLAAPDGTTSRTYGAAGSFGTSFASPTTAGAAALLLEQDASRQAADLAATLASMAVDVGAAGPDNSYGAGLLNLELATCAQDADCQDALFCNGVETCQGGQCQPGAAPDCADAVACTVDTCDEAAGACSHAPNHGACGDGNSCTTDSCDAQAGCQSAPVADGTGCNDADACTSGESCTGGACGGGEAVVCYDGLFCNGSETCNPAAGCQAGTPPACGDAYACTADACDEATDSCTHAPNDALCNDNNACTTDTCNPGAGGCTYAVVCAPALAAETFETNTWSGGTGWLAAWSRSGDTALSNAAGPHGGTYHARLRRGTGTITRAVNLTGVTGARLRFWWKGNSFEGNENAVAQVSTNGSTWTNVATLPVADANNTYRFVDVPLTAPYSSNYRVRFKAQMGDQNDQLYVDDIEVTGTR